MRYGVLEIACALLLCASSASAAGLNLAWDNCYPTSGSSQDKSFQCDDTAPEAMDANEQSFVLYGSVIPGVNVNGLIAWGASLDFETLSAVLDDWWKVGAGQCREGAVGFHYNGFTNATSCNKQIMVTSQASPTSNWMTPYPGRGSNSSQLSLGVARTSGFNVVGTTQYQLFTVTIDSHNTKINGDGTTVECAGCLDPICIVLMSVELYVPIAQKPPDGRTIIAAVDHQGYVTWQGGGGMNCAAIAMHPTWGQVRSFYR